MRNYRNPTFFAHLHLHFLPHPNNDLRAHLLKSPSLITYIVFLITLTLGFNLISIAKPGVLGFASNIKKEDVLILTNNQRAALNLPSLSENYKLSQAAADKANNMFAKNYWAHIAPDGTTPWTFIKNAGYSYSAAGENLARDFSESQSVVAAWMASPSHRENIVNDHYKDIGIGVVNGILDGKETTLVVQMFGAQSAINLAAGNISKAPIAVVTTTPAHQPSPTTTIQTTPITTPAQSETSLKPTFTPKLTTSPSIVIPASQQGKPFINSFKILRSASLVIIFLLAFLLTADLVVARKARWVRATGHGIAHLGILLILLLAIWYTNSGLIL